AGFAVEGMPVVGVRVGGELYAYRDPCPGCGGSLAEGTLARRLGGAAGDAVLRCPACAAHFDVRRAGRGLDGTDVHLEPVPLLVPADGAELRYRAVPDRYLSFADVVVDARQWDELEIPVGLAFFFANSQLGRTVAFYPGPAGATESELPLGAWDRVVDAHPVL